MGKRDLLSGVLGGVDDLAALDVAGNRVLTLGKRDLLSGVLGGVDNLADLDVAGKRVLSLGKRDLLSGVLGGVDDLAALDVAGNRVLTLGKRDLLSGVLGGVDNLADLDVAKECSHWVKEIYSVASLAEYDLAALDVAGNRVLTLGKRDLLSGVLGGVDNLADLDVAGKRVLGSHWVKEIYSVASLAELMIWLHWTLPATGF